MGSDLAGFLAARLDEDEDYARIMTEVGERRAAAATPADMADAFSLVITLLDDPQAQAVLEHWTTSGHLPPNDLKRVLREAEAKRKILAEHEPQPWGEPQPQLSRCPAHGDETTGWWTMWPCVEIRALAAVWSDHPDYDEAWRP